MLILSLHLVINLPVPTRLVELKCTHYLLRIPPDPGMGLGRSGFDFS
jgi:hypothetical protein